MHVSPEQPIYSQAPLQLLLFIDQCPSSQQQIEQIRYYLRELQAEYPFALQVVDVGEQPSVAEQFKLVTTPTLIKIHPEPRQTLAGSNLISQLKNWWFRWQHTVEHLKPQNVIESIDKDDLVSTPKTLSSVTDSVELLRLADEVFHLKHEQEKLLEQLHFKDQVISMLAHDLRNPLTAVSIAIETLESNLVPHKSTRLTPALTSQLFKQARTQTRTIERMITRLLQVTSSTVALRIQPQKLELGKLCQEVIAQVSDRASSKFQGIETDIPHDLSCVYADLERVAQVLTNLLDNAIKYTPVGGIIRLCGFQRTTQKIQISVYDTGPGIPEADRDCIFEERFRLERNAAKEGSGISLSLCQLIIQAHYGQLWVDSPSTGGSCFHFTLPVYPN